MREEVGIVGHGEAIEVRAGVALTRHGRLESAHGHTEESKMTLSVEDLEGLLPHRGVQSWCT